MNHIKTWASKIQESGLCWAWISVLVVMLDQVSKLMASSLLVYGHPFVIITGLQMTLLHNPGGAFSFLAHAGGWQHAFFIVVSSVVSLVLLWMLSRLETFEVRANLGLVLVLGGALGNLYDRVVLGYVIDFIDFHVGNLHWPPFNIADSAICIGAILLVMSSSVLEKAYKTNTA